MAAEPAMTTKTPGTTSRCERAGLDALAVTVASCWTTYEEWLAGWSGVAADAAALGGPRMPRNDSAPIAATRTRRARPAALPVLWRMRLRTIEGQCYGLVSVIRPVAAWPSRDGLCT